MTGPVGIREVAERAGVSVGTVSNVLNKPDIVSKRTLAKVLQVIDDLGFVRNDLARQLKMGGGTTLGMIVLNVANPFFAELAHASEAAAEQLGYTVVLGSSDQLAGREDRYIDLFEEQRVRGMLIAPLEGTTQRMRRLRQRGMPLVLFDIRGDGGDFCSVAMDGDAGGYLAATHLVQQGKRYIAFLGGPLHQVQDRWVGALRACAETSGVKLTHIDTVDQTIADGNAAGDELARMPAAERPDAVFAANDLLALGLMQSLVRAGIRLPHDIAIVGYDDIDYAASAIVPLSTIRQPQRELAREAIRLVLDEAADPSGHQHEHLRLPPELVVRESSKST
ncbi:LacI family DNA-binding transcriptional regulator [Humibacter sp. RRB41]|uniref:LacI family DNA-binding transcriptional regulator n=1 Tax=Humibacter sp. RRB41 TaxID=2919946 RepID=UPI001FA9A3FF|nr:LacI family DNA-binding transcriptional regulator [Humibacter sp. RRB41]